MHTSGDKMRPPGLRRLKYVLVILGAVFAVSLIKLWLQPGAGTTPSRTQGPSLHVGDKHGAFDRNQLKPPGQSVPTVRQRPKPVQKPGVQILNDMVVGGQYDAARDEEYVKQKNAKKTELTTKMTVPLPPRIRENKLILNQPLHQTSAGGQVEIKSPTPDPNLAVIELQKEELKAIQDAKPTPLTLKTIRPINPATYPNCTNSSIPYVGTGFRTDKYCLLEDEREYFKPFANLKCYLLGTDLARTERRFRRHQECACKDGWHGMECSMPDVVYRGGYPYQYGVAISRPTKRIIHGFPFHGEFEMLETRLHTLGDAVDVYLILESNYTSAGKPKKRALLNQLKDGYLREFQHKIVYISLDYFPTAAYANGWVIDGLLRNQIGYVGLGHVLQNVRDNDVFVLTDADEIIQPEALMFLKIHFGYPEPFGFLVRHTVYGFFWEAEDKTTIIYGGCSIGFLRELLSGKVYDIRSAPRNLGRIGSRSISKYKRRSGARVVNWHFGSVELPAGWHCSWCFLPKGIQNKLISAHAADFPRWGTFPEKTALPFIRDLVRMGLWFDEKTQLNKLNKSDQLYAPAYIRNRPVVFRHLLDLKEYMALADKKRTVISSNTAT